MRTILILALVFTFFALTFTTRPRAAMEHEEIVARLAAGLPVPGLRYATCRPHHRLRRHCSRR